MFERRDRLRRRLQREKFFSDLLYAVEETAKESEVYPIMHDAATKLVKRDPSVALHLGVPPTDFSGNTIVAEFRFGVQPVIELPADPDGNKLWRSHGVRAILTQNFNPQIYYLSGSLQSMAEIEGAVSRLAEAEKINDLSQLDEMKLYAQDVRRSEQGWIRVDPFLPYRQAIVTAMTKSSLTPGYFDFRKGNVSGDLKGRPSLDIITRRIQIAK